MSRLDINLFLLQVLEEDLRARVGQLDQLATHVSALAGSPDLTAYAGQMVERLHLLQDTMAGVQAGLAHRLAQLQV